MKNGSAISFSPVLFVGIGATFGFYTLRETYLHERWVGGAGGYMDKTVRSFHHRNLANTADLAWTKANEAGKAMGIPMITEREGMEEEMRKLTRASADEMKERAYKAAVEANERSEDNDFYMMLNLTKYPVSEFAGGKYAGKTFAEVNKFDRGYLEWMASREEFRFPSDELSNLALKTFLENYEAVLVANDEHFGELKTRYEFEATIVSTMLIDSDYGGSTLVKMIDENGYRLATFYSGYKWEPKAGEEIRFKATVKKHGDYKGVNETMVNRVAVLS